MKNNEVFPQLFYLNNFSFCRNNVYLNSRLNDYIQTVLYSNDESYYITYLRNVKNEYNNYNNYMYILECIINYIIKIYNVTFEDYKNNNFDECTKNVLINIKNRYNNVINLYDDELIALNDTKKEKNYNKNKYKKIVKHKIKR